MAEYIEREALLSRFQAHKSLFIDAWGGFDKLPPQDKARVDELDNCISEILNMTAADVVEVVRCNDCKHRGDAFECPMCHEEYDDCVRDYATYNRTEDDNFCKYGERKGREDGL